MTRLTVALFCLSLFSPVAIAGSDDSDTRTVRVSHVFDGVEDQLRFEFDVDGYAIDLRIDLEDGLDQLSEAEFDAYLDANTVYTLDAVQPPYEYRSAVVDLSEADPAASEEAMASAIVYLLDGQTHLYRGSVGASTPLGLTHGSESVCYQDQATGEKSLVRRVGGFIAKRVIPVVFVYDVGVQSCDASERGWGWLSVPVGTYNSVAPWCWFGWGTL